MEAFEIQMLTRPIFGASADLVQKIRLLAFTRNRADLIRAAGWLLLAVAIH